MKICKHLNQILNPKAGTYLLQVWLQHKRLSVAVVGQWQRVLRGGGARPVSQGPRVRFRGNVPYTVHQGILPVGGRVAGAPRRRRRQVRVPTRLRTSGRRGLWRPLPAPARRPGALFVQRIQVI